MAKCAFLGIDYDVKINGKRQHRPNLEIRSKLMDAMFNLIRNENVNLFMVGNIGGFEKDAYDIVLHLSGVFNYVSSFLVISNVCELFSDEYDIIGYEKSKLFTGVICPNGCKNVCKQAAIIQRNNYLIKNADFIITYNKHQGLAYEFCKKAAKKGAKIIELS